MAEFYQAVFCGEVLEDADPGVVREQLEELGVLQGIHAEEAFAGRPIVIRDRLTEEQATKFAGALATANARCRVLPESWLVCPSCRFPQERGDECLKCGLIFAKHRERDLPPLRTRFEIAADLQDAGYSKFDPREAGTNGDQ